MSYVLNDPADFVSEAIEGFVAAHETLVRRVPGGVARRAATPEGQVALVIGGGSGHYPTFAGLVGQGIAHGAAMGNVFASPSTHQVVSVARAVATPAGVLLSYGNYAGDTLNFDQAEAELRAAGIPCETVRVTDDVYSAPATEAHKRRGIAGMLPVFRAAGWAAAEGLDLAGVTALAARANARTRSVGVAFSGCTLPGADKPLFTVPEGQMGVGIGIHGEPGIDIMPRPRADALGAMLTSHLLAELPDGVNDARGARAAVVLNGLGAIKAEELFVLYASVRRALKAAGVTIVEPEVGEFATSFEMAGLSLTLCWLDDELEKAWRAPALTPAFRKGQIAGASITDMLADVEDDADGGGRARAIVAAATPEAAAAGKAAARAIIAIRDVIDAEAEELGRLDQVAGDGDHGIGMQHGARAATKAAEAAAAAGAGAGGVLQEAGAAWADQAGGTSGALWGLALRTLGRAIGDEAAPDAATVARGITAAEDALRAAGKAEPGDKTMMDAIIPFADCLTREAAAGKPLGPAWQQAALAATMAAQATADLVPRLGRARAHHEKSVGTPDPGAVSFALAVTAAGGVLMDCGAKGA